MAIIRCECHYTTRLGLILAGIYLWGNALFTIVLVEWDYEKTILFMQGELEEENLEHMQRDVLNALLVGLNMACGMQMFTVTFFLLYGTLIKKRGLIVTWLWCHTFQLAFYIVYLFAGILVFAILRDKEKVLLLMYGLINVLIGICTWRMAFDYVKVDTVEQVTERSPEFDYIY